MAVQVPGSSNKPAYGSVVAGPNGFLIVTWPDGTKQETEVSNLALTVAAAEKNKPAVLKRPAAAKKVKATGPDGEALSEAEPELPSASAADDAAEGQTRKRAKASCAAVVPAASAAVPAPAASSAVPAPAAASYSEPLPRNADKHPVLKQESPEFGTCRTFRGRDKSYIQYYDEDCNRWVSVVNFTGQQVRFRHNECLMHVWRRLREPGFGEAEVAELKKFLVAHPTGLDVD